MAATAALYKLWKHSDDRVRRSAIHHCTRILGHREPKPLQYDAIAAVLDGKDTFVTVPTGYGKSLVYMLLPLCAQYILDALEDKPATPPVPCVLPCVEERSWSQNRSTGRV